MARPRFDKRVGLRASCPTKSTCRNRPEYIVEFWKALGSAQRDAGIDGSLRTAKQFAIAPNATHMTLAIDPMLPEIVERLLGTG